MRTLVAIAVLALAGCGGTGVDRRVTRLAHVQLAVPAGATCRQEPIAVLWPAYRRNLPLYSCSDRRRGWCVLVSPRGNSTANVTEFVYEALHRATADWAVRPECLRWDDVERELQPPGGDPEVADLPARLNRP